MASRAFWASSGSREGEFVQAPAPCRPRTSFWDTHANARNCSHNTQKQTRFPFPALLGFSNFLRFPKSPWRCRGASFFENSPLYIVFCGPPGAFGPLRAPSGGPRGPHRQTKVTTTLRPVLGGVLRVRAGAQWSTRPQITTGICAECLRRDRRVFTNPRKI